jgi:hypothetical protein
MDYGRLFSRAWEIVWNNKFMFLLGFLAALGVGGGGANTNFRVGSGNLPPEITTGFERFFERFGPLLIGLGCLAFIIGLIFWLIRLAAQAGLISAAARIEAGEKMTFSSAFSAGTRVLGRMIGINLLLYGPFIILIIIVAAIFATTIGAAVASSIAGGNTSDIEALTGGLSLLAICIGCLACLLVPLGLLISVIYPFAQRGAVLGNLGVIDSIRHGWQVVKANVGDIILLIIFFLVLGFIFGLVAAVVLLPFAFIAFGPAFFRLMGNDVIQAIDIIAILIGGILIGLVAAVINSIMVAFRSTTITLAYQEFIKKAAAKV